MPKTKKNKRNFSVKILKKYCKGCGLCIEVCREEKIEIDPSPNERGICTVRVSREAVCSGCLRCTAICPDGGIEIYRNGHNKKTNDRG